MIVIIVAIKINLTKRSAESICVVLRIAVEIKILHYSASV